MSDLAEAYLRNGDLPALPDKHFIAGDWRASVDGARMESLDPGLGQPFHSFAAGGAADVDLAVSAAQRAQPGWGATKASERGAILARAAALLREEAVRFAFVESLDCGKPLQEAEGDVAGAARCFEYYAGAADKQQGDTFPLGPDYLSYSLREPVGPTAHVIPWNFPISTAARSIAPALAAGCAVIAKPAETSPLTMLMLAELLARAGLPGGVCNAVTGTGAQAGAPLVAHPGVRHVTFTGSVATGTSAMRAAAGNVASVLLELGGKSPAIVLEDADLDRAARDIAGAIYENAGQICSAASRLIAMRGVADELVERIAAHAQALRLGHGLRRPGMGPLNSAAQLERVAGHVSRAKARGVTVRTGGAATTPADGATGWFYAPTILTGAAENDPVAQEEIFGPVLTVQIARNEQEALRLANGTEFGLVAGVYTRDLGAAHRLARGVEAGQVYINEYFAGGVETPFGGTRRSGVGREKGVIALDAYSRVKAVTARIAADD